MKPFALAFGFALTTLVAAAHAGVSLVSEPSDTMPSASATPESSTPPPAGAAAASGSPQQPSEKPSESDNATIDMAPDPRCDFNPPGATLIAARYADYRAVRHRDDPNRSPGDLTETATLADGTRVRIESHGCVDSFGHDFVFRYAHPAHAAKDVVFWLQQARTTLDALALTDSPIGVDALRTWLTRAATLKHHGNKIVQCANTTQPADNDCDWRSGGGYSFAVEARDGAIEVTIGTDFSG